jgi:hypothetical protein
VIKRQLKLMENGQMVELKDNKKSDYAKMHNSPMLPKKILISLLQKLEAAKRAHH